MSDCVNFEIAKLLKEKGFNIPGRAWYGEYTSDFGGDKHIVIKFDDNCRFNTNYKFLFYAPSIYVVMKWLREEKNLCIEPYRTGCGYLSTISKIPTGSELYSQEYEGDDEDSGQFTTYEKSCEAAIKYCLENLI